ncbi:MAG TPA: hypothetical protein VIJ85_07230 [Rhizomicrobium sp.]
MAATAAATSFAALGAPLYPQGAVALESQLIAAQSADAKAWIKDEAGREATLHNVNEETPRNAARKFGATGSDVSKLAFLVLMEASRTADANVANLVNGVQGASASRQDIRQAQMNDNVIAGAQQGQRSGGEQTAEQAQGQAFLSLLPENSDDNPIAQAKRAQAVPAPTMTLQDAMDRQNQIEDLLKVAMTNVTQPT